MAKQIEDNKSIDCRQCKLSDKNKIGDFMIYCNKLNVYRSFGSRYCKLKKR